jgi:hypothetical protein
MAPDGVFNYGSHFHLIASVLTSTDILPRKVNLNILKCYERQLKFLVSSNSSALIRRVALRTTCRQNCKCFRRNVAHGQFYILAVR